MRASIRSTGGGIGKSLDSISHLSPCMEWTTVRSLRVRLLVFSEIAKAQGRRHDHLRQKLPGEAPDPKPSEPRARLASREGLGSATPACLPKKHHSTGPPGVFLFSCTCRAFGRVPSVGCHGLQPKRFKHLAQCRRTEAKSSCSARVDFQHLLVVLPPALHRARQQADKDVAVHLAWATERQARQKHSPPLMALEPPNPEPQEHNFGQLCQRSSSLVRLPSRITEEQGKTAQAC